jgi:hypothetical protein
LQESDARVEVWIGKGVRKEASISMGVLSEPVVKGSKNPAEVGFRHRTKLAYVGK